MLKRDVAAECMRPKFSILDPSLTYTLPEYQSMAGISDILAHIMERYFTNVGNVDVTDKLCEGVMRSVIQQAPSILKDGSDYRARAEVMLAGTIAHNDLLGMGRIGDWASHQIEHELSAAYDLAHGAGLAIVIPAWMKYVYKHDIPRFVQFACEVMGIENDEKDPQGTALKGIYALQTFFESIKMPTSLKQVQIPKTDIPKLAAKCNYSAEGYVGNFVRLGYEDVRKILQIAYEIN